MTVSISPNTSSSFGPMATGVPVTSFSLRLLISVGSRSPSPIKFRKSLTSLELKLSNSTRPMVCPVPSTPCHAGGGGSGESGLSVAAGRGVLGLHLLILKLIDSLTDTRQSSGPEIAGCCSKLCWIVESIAPPTGCNRNRATNDGDYRHPPGDAGWSLVWEPSSWTNPSRPGHVEPVHPVNPDRGHWNRIADRRGDSRP